jgi:hypothetical protein
MGGEPWPCATWQASAQLAARPPPGSDDTGQAQQAKEGVGPRAAGCLHRGVTEEGKDKQDTAQRVDSARRPDAAEPAGAPGPQHAGPKGSGGRRLLVPPRKPLVSFEAAFGLL